MHDRPFTFESVLPIAYPYLLKLSRGILSNEAKVPDLIARDCLHEIIVKNWNHQFNDSAHLYRFIALVIRRMVIDHLRTQRVRRRARKELRALAEPQNPFFESIDALDVEIALRALAGKSESWAQVATLHHALGLGNTEIEAIAGVSPVTVNRALRSSMQWLTDFWNSQDGIRSGI